MADTLKSKHRLVSFVKDDVFQWFKTEREREIDPLWSAAYDAFRGNYDSDVLQKWKQLEGNDWRSKVFVRLTKMKVVAAVSQIEDVFFQGGEIPFDITPTPVPESGPGMVMPPEIARHRCNRMRERIKDLMVEGNYERTLMSSILEMAIYGMSVHKVPVLKPKKSISYRTVLPDVEGIQYIPPELAARYAVQEMVITESLIPTIDHINLWDFFWDMEAPNLHDGIGCIHRVRMSKGALRTLGDGPDYDEDAISRVISAASDGLDGYYDTSDSPGRRKLSKRWSNIEVIEFSGRVPIKYLDETTLDTSKLDGREIEVIVTIAGDEIIRQPKLNTLPLGRRPYSLAKWEEIPHEVQGVGIAENLKDSQMMINAGVRCFIDNKSLSGNLILAGNRRALAPGQDTSVYPGKYFELADHVQDVRQAMQWFSPPDIGRGMMDLIAMFREFSDMESNLPSIMQGQQETHSPRTAFAFSRLLENANKQLGKVIRNIDEGHIEENVKTLYYWLMATDPDPEIKGDYQIKATGFGSFKDRVIQADNLQNLFMLAMSNQLIAQMTKAPEFVREIARVRGVDPDRFFMTDAELEQKAMMMQAMMSQPPQMQGSPPMEGPPGVAGPPVIGRSVPGNPGPPGGQGGPGMPGTHNVAQGFVQ